MEGSMLLAVIALQIEQVLAFSTNLVI